MTESLRRAISLKVGDVVVHLAETESIDALAVRDLAESQRRLNSQGRKLIFRSPSQLDVLVGNLLSAGADNPYGQVGYEEVFAQALGNRDDYLDEHAIVCAIHHVSNELDTDLQVGDRKLAQIGQ